MWCYYHITFFRFSQVSVGEGSARSRKRKRQAFQLVFLCVIESDGALNLVRTQASCTDIHMARSTVNDRLDALDVGLPSSVGTSVGMGDLNAERNALAANIALCHHCTSLPLKVVRRLKTPTIIIAELPEKCKHFFPVSANFFRSAGMAAPQCPARAFSSPADAYFSASSPFCRIVIFTGVPVRPKTARI